MMRVISNSPREAVVLEVEARKSFSFGVWVKTSNGSPVDLLDTEFSLTVGRLNKDHTVDNKLDVAGTVDAPSLGFVRFNVQASELDFEPGTYQFTVVMIALNYGTALVKGDFVLIQNTEFDSMSEDYDFAQPSQALEAVLKSQGDVHVTLSTVLPPSLLHLPPGGTTGQVLVRLSNEPGAVAWATLDGGLTGAGQPYGYAPLTDGNGGWDWTPVATPSQVTQAEENAEDYADELHLQAMNYADELHLQATEYADGVGADVLDAAIEYTDTEIDDVKIWATAQIAVSQPVGVIELWAGDTAPTNFMFCQGQAVSRTTYAALFSVLGTKYGVGDGSTTFNLPNLKGRVPVGLDTAQSEFNTLGKTGGEKKHVLTEAEMPSHTHIQNAHNHTQNAHGHSLNQSNIWYNSGGSANIASGSSTNRATANVAANNTTATNQATTATNQATGGDEAHNNLQPYLVLNYIIKVA